MSPRKRLQRRSRSTESDRREILKEYRKSGLSQTRFAESRDLSVSTLRSWLRKSPSTAQTDKPTGKLLPVRVISDPWIGTPPSSGLSFEIFFHSGRRLRVPSGFDPHELKDLIDLLDSSC